MLSLFDSLWSVEYLSEQCRFRTDWVEADTVLNHRSAWVVLKSGLGSGLICLSPIFYTHWTNWTVNTINVYNLIFWKNETYIYYDIGID